MVLLIFLPSCPQDQTPLQSSSMRCRQDLSPSFASFTSWFLSFASFVLVFIMMILPQMMFIWLTSCSSSLFLESLLQLLWEFRFSRHSSPQVFWVVQTDWSSIFEVLNERLRWFWTIWDWPTAIALVIRIFWPSMLVLGLTLLLQRLHLLTLAFYFGSTSRLFSWN